MPNPSVEPKETLFTIIPNKIIDKARFNIAKKIPLFGETVKDKYFIYKVLSHSRKQISKIEISIIK